jgi:hypothetical protein
VNQVNDVERLWAGGTEARVPSHWSVIKNVNSIFGGRVRIGCVYFSFRWTWEWEIKIVS